MGFIKEFKDFAMRGNLVDFAIGVVVGGAFGRADSGGGSGRGCCRRVRAQSDREIGSCFKIHVVGKAENEARIDVDDCAGGCGHCRSGG